MTDGTGRATDEDPGGGPDPRLLEELDQHIRDARAAAEEAFADSGHTFAERADAESAAEGDGPADPDHPDD